MKKNIITTLLFSFLTLGTISTSIVLANKETIFTPTFATYQNHDAETYYAGVSDELTEKDLLGKLQSLNSGKRKSTVGYGAMGTSASGMFRYTDYDPTSVQYDGNDQPFGTKILSFYSGNSCTHFNREHVWPDSRGGGSVDSDIHMPRPTIPEENGSRGNSFYVEGKCDRANGWDPAMESFGDATYRGDSARIIFYCMVANSSLKLIDEEYITADNKTMGKLSDILKWHLNYPVLEREMNRNEGAEYLQGNRNPFIDHPEYVCRIWGNTNETTRSLCENDPYVNSAPTEIKLNYTKLDLKVGETKQIAVSSVLPVSASKSVTWSSSNSSIISIDEKGAVTAHDIGDAVITATSNKDGNIKATCTVHGYIPEDVELSDIAVLPNPLELVKGYSNILNVKYLPEEAFPVPSHTLKSNNTEIAAIDESGTITGMKVGRTTITVTATQGQKTVSKDVPVIVTENVEEEFTLVTNNNDLKDHDRVVLALDLDSNGVSGVATKDAEISADMDEWVRYEVTDANINGFRLYDPGMKKYIANPTGNEFKYSDEAGAGRCKVNVDGVLTCNNRFFVKNGNFCRFYSSIGSYEPFHIYKVIGTPVPPEKALESISVFGQTDTYNLKDNFAFDGTCVAYFDDGTTEEVTPTSVSTPDMTTAGEKDITVSYTYNGVTKTTPYRITVIDPTSPRRIDYVAVTHMPNKTTYYVGETFDPTGIEVTAYYENSEEEIATDYNIVIPDDFSTTAGEKILKVVLVRNGLSCFVPFKIMVIEKPEGNKGCGGELITTSVILSTISLIGVALILIKKHKEA